ncbi:hypothetical protein CEUSTIGMA_g9431.t1 [Chlamydomonas eustigma]|uniref:Cns1/TTC4 wheel domain-containing protein n=1 Tax=Chlamydomonas eustigma TaxID=1157962 RepID=A0A250XG29_9CHLO|nr:hypothetical protein CEUSTIGMA_g9431.t1 [Chlamydomonas eustigma]|eukprot:GAX82003.1 hypothetical protein CEUSTIGMA_g9431.t1 [Chlamydomonas eustigma]
MSDSDSDTEPDVQIEEDSNAGLHPLFWDAIPDGAEQDPNWQALEALKNESTLEERAENFKVQGNRKLKTGLEVNNKHILREAVDFYSNWRKCLEDGLIAQKLDSDNVKAYFRAAKAALELGQFKLCREQCEKGQAKDSKALQFSSILKSAQERESIELQKKTAEELRKMAHLAPFQKLADAILSRGIKVCLPQVRLEDRYHPTLDEAGHLQWPVMIMYPEAMQQDSIECFHEEDTVAAQMDEMFGPDTPPLSWDSKGEYTRDRVELYYLSYAGRPLDREQLILAVQGKWPDGSADSGPQRYGQKAAMWRQVDQQMSLLQLLTCEDYVVPGIPLLFAIAKGTEYKKRFLSQGMK